MGAAGSNAERGLDDHNPEVLGSLTVEDDPAGTADLAGSATTDDAEVGPSANEADDL